MRDARAFTKQEARQFFVYFDLADEIWPRDERHRLGPQLTLADMDRKAVMDARVAATTNGLSWPPDLAEAEEYLLTHGPALRHALDWVAP
jgi:hypothetical protein